MAVIDKTTTSANVAAALDQEFVRAFDGEYSRLAELIGIFGVEHVPAGTALKMLKVTGELADASSYKEGDEVSLTQLSTAWETVADAVARPYRKLTTGAAIQKAGYENAVLATDRKMLSLVRDGIVKDFFVALAKGSGAATGTGLQGALAKADAKLGDTMEGNGDATSRIVHFVNRQDAADYLASAPVTTQTVFGMTYLQNFLGATDVFLTSKVTAGTLYATPVENLHMYAIDFDALNGAGLEYTTSDSGLVGVAHVPVHNRVSVETDVLSSMVMFPEVKDYIVKGTVAPIA